MKVTLRAEKVENILADALIVNEFEGVKVPGGATGAADKGLGGLLSRMTRDGEFTGRLEEIIVVHGSGKLKAKKIILVGLGKREKFDLEAVRKAAGAAIRAAKHAKCKTVASIIHGAGIGGLDPKDAATATIEGTLSAAYKFKGYATTNEHPEHKIQEFILVDHGTAKINAIKQAVKDTVLICDAVNSVRDLVNAPGNIVTPEYFANAAKKLAKSVSGLTCQIIDAPQIRKMGMGAFYSIAKGSDEREKMVRSASARLEASLIRRFVELK